MSSIGIPIMNSDKKLAQAVVILEQLPSKLYSAILLSFITIYITISSQQIKFPSCCLTVNFFIAKFWRGFFAYSCIIRFCSSDIGRR